MHISQNGRAKIAITVGFCLALVFLLLGVRAIVRSSGDDPAASTPTTAAQPTIAVLAAAARPIAVGETITADMVRNAPGDPQRFPAAATASEVVGKVATRPIAAGTLIWRAALGTEQSLSIRVPAGLRAVSMDTSAEVAVAGLVRPGDLVDVQVVYPGADAISGARGAGRSRAGVLLQAVRVLAVGDLVVGTAPGAIEEGAAPQPAPPTRTITLALRPDQISAFTLAKNTGSLYLALRHPSDVLDVAVPALASAGLPQPREAAPAAVAAGPMIAPVRQVARPVQRQPQPIELVVGDQRQVIYPGGGR